MMVTNIKSNSSSLDELILNAPVILNSDLEAMAARHPGCGAFKQALWQIPNEAALLRTLSSYIYFNSVFGSGVANLAGEIGVRHDLFRDTDEPVEIVADRSVEVGAHIFFAAIDEFGGNGKARCTHRTLAQATLKAAGSFFNCETFMLDRITRPNEQTFTAIDKVRDGYVVNQTVTEEDLFRAIGFHLGSEVLADHEFNILDHYLRSQYAGLVEYLRTTRVTINGIRVPPYRWVEIHTIVETDHFNAGLVAANLALRYYAGTENPAQIKEWINEGFREFMAVQLQFMNGLME